MYFIPCTNEMSTLQHPQLQMLLNILTLGFNAGDKFLNEATADVPNNYHTILGEKGIVIVETTNCDSNMSPKTLG